MADTVQDSIGGITVDGTCAPGFEGVREAFRANFAERGEVGASVCVTHRGQTVVDLWGGMASPKTNAPWQRDTVSIVFSCTKGATALCAHMLAERGELSLHDDVAKWWPEFGPSGKAGTTLAMMLAHTSPVPHLRDPVRAGGYADCGDMVDALAAEPAWWVPGHARAITASPSPGRLATWCGGRGRDARRVLRARSRRPLGLDFHIGLPESEEARVAPMIATDPGEANFAPILPAGRAARQPAASLRHQ